MASSQDITKGQSSNSNAQPNLETVIGDNTRRITDLENQLSG